MAQSFDDQLKHAFGTIADRLRQELDREVHAASQQLRDAIDAERADAASQAARDAITATEREVSERLSAHFAEREAQAAEQARVREAAHAEALEGARRAHTDELHALRQAHADAMAAAEQASSGALRAAEEARAALEARLAEREAAHAQREEQVRTESYAAGLDAGLQQGRAELEARLRDQETAFAEHEARVRLQAHAEGLAAGDAQRSDLEAQLRARESEMAAMQWSMEARLTDAVQAAETRARQAAQRLAAEVMRAADDRAIEAAQAADARMADLRVATDTRVSELRRVAEADALQHFQSALEAVRVLDTATSLSQALDALGAALSRHADRAALFLVRDGALRTWSRYGFDSHQGAQPIEISLGAAGIAAEAVTMRTMRYADAAMLASPDVMRPALALLKECHAAVAAPVLMHGKPIAVLYAELEQAPEHPRLPLLCELLARHAARLLESLTVARLSQLGAAVAPDASTVGA